MKKLALILLVCLVVAQLPVVSVSAHDPAEGMKKFKIGLSWNEKIHSLIQAWQDYMQSYGDEYAARNGMEFEWVINVADGDPTRQAANIEDLINQNVDIIVARAQDAAAIGASAKAADEAGIPFITFDRESATFQPTSHVGADSLNQSISTSLAFAKILEDNGVEGKCIEVMGDLTDMNAVFRSNGWQKVEEEVGQWETVVQVPTEWKAEKFKSGTANALAAHPEANCMFVASDFAFSAVQSALEDAGKWAPAGEEGHMWIAAQDVNPQGYDAMVGGYIDVATTYDAFFHAVELINAMGRTLIDDPVQPRYLVPGRVATPGNVEELDNMWARDYAD
jgi:ribose transport system substrate-binding protein